MEQVFGREAIPHYEINQRTVTLLHELMLKSNQQDKYARICIDDMAQKAEEYSIEGIYMIQCRKNIINMKVNNQL